MIAVVQVYDLENPKVSAEPENYFFGIFSCCFRPPRRRELQLHSTHSNSNLSQALANRPARYGMPAKMPSMTENEKSKAGKICLALDLDETLVHSSFSVRTLAYYSYSLLCSLSHTNLFDFINVLQILIFCSLYRMLITLYL